jgi:23S rRNA (adenine2503-C2)-methyltransferase
MKIAAYAGNPDVAMVYVGEFEDERLVEFVEAIQPPKTIDDKWVLMISILYGCPVKCIMCDAGGFYHGKVSKEKIFEQIDYLVDKKFSDRNVTSKQFKIQFARMGDPALNMDVLDVLRELPERYNAPGLMPSLSSIAPHGTDEFFDELIGIKDEFYSNGRFQFQFSIHTTDEELRDKIVPVKKWSFEKMSEYGKRYHKEGDRKITLNFALVDGNPVDPNVLLKYFDPELFLIKITPLNPTYSAEENELQTYLKPGVEPYQDVLITQLEQAGYQVIASIGDPEEDLIGSNCGQYIQRHIRSDEKIENGYVYELNN